MLPKRREFTFGSISELFISQILCMRIFLLKDIEDIKEVVCQLNIFSKHANFIKTTPEVIFKSVIK